MAQVNVKEFAEKLSQYARCAGDAQSCRLWLYANAPRMDKAAKIEADGVVVAALEAKFGLVAEASSRPLYSGWTFKGKSDAANAARVALHKARQILDGKKQAPKKREKGARSAAFESFMERLTSDKEAIAAKAREEITALWLTLKSAK